MNGTVLEQALWSAYDELRLQDASIIDILIKAGAVIETGWEKYIQ